MPSATDTPSAAVESAEETVGTLAAVTTRGVLRDARNGAPIPRSCVGYRTLLTSPTTRYTNVQNDGTWSIRTDDAEGPVSLAFYVVDGDNNDVNCGGTLSDDYVPSWYRNQPFNGTVIGNALPPAGSTDIDPGSSAVEACLAPDRLPTACTEPTTRFSGRVVGAGQSPINRACIFALGSAGPLGQAITSADGRWTIDNLPINFPLVVGVLPPFDVGEGPCVTEDGPPPVPAGELQPEFYTNTWANVADDDLGDNPYGWAVARGAQSITNNRSGIDVCLTTDAGTVVPRPLCDPASPTPQPTPTQSATVVPITNPDPPGSDDSGLANTGGPSGWLTVLAVGLTALGAVVVRRATGRRR